MTTRIAVATAMGVALLGITPSALAELQGRDLDGNPLTYEAYYDDVLNVTWLADANFARTSGFDADGRMDWPTALAWVADLEYHGLRGWRLPKLLPSNGTSFTTAFSNNGSTDYGYGSRGEGSELGHLYYTTLGNKGRCTPDDAKPYTCIEPPDWGLRNAGPFANLAGVAGHWTSAESMCPCGSLKTWLLDMMSGQQYQMLKGNLFAVWPVMDGDVGPERNIVRLTLKSAAVTGCRSVTGTVTVSRAAPAEGVVVSLSDTLEAARVSSTVTVPYGAFSKSFTVYTQAVADPVSGEVRATLGGRSLVAALALKPMGLYSVSLSPSSVVGGGSSVGTVKLPCTAGPGPITVALASSVPAVAGPVATSVVVPVGLRSATFDVTSTTVYAKSPASITATANGSTKSRTLTVLTEATASPTSLKFGSHVVGSSSPAQVVVLTNRGTAPITVGAIAITGTSAAWFQQSHDCPATLAAGASCRVSVRFVPLGVASKTAKLSLPSSATSAPLSVSLSGQGTSGT